LNDHRKKQFEAQFYEVNSSHRKLQQHLNCMYNAPAMKSFRLAIVDLPKHYVPYYKYRGSLPFGPYEMSVLGLPCTYDGKKWMCSQPAADKFIEIWMKSFPEY
jgi:hypothetical protein